MRKLTQELNRNTKMLRRNPAEASSAGIRGLDGLDHDNDKGSKMKRRKDSQTKAIFFCLAVIAFLGVVAKVHVNHLQKYTTKRLRRALGENKEGKVDSPSAIDFLPPHSVYNIEVEDIHGKIVDFSSFRGMITLIVNVACS